MANIKITILFTSKFQEFCKKFNSILTQDQIEKKIQSFLEGTRTKWEVTLPNGENKGVVFFKLKCENKTFSERWVGCLLTKEFNVIPVFFANKQTRIWDNVSGHAMDEIFWMFRAIVSELKSGKGDTIGKTITLWVDTIDFGNFSLSVN